MTGEHHLTTTALLTLVAIDQNGSKVEVPPLKLETAAERAGFEVAHTRRRARLERKGSVVAWQRLLEP